MFVCTSVENYKASTEHINTHKLRGYCLPAVVRIRLSVEIGIQRLGCGFIDLNIYLFCAPSDAFA